VQIEGEMIRKATETKLKRYWYALLGKELYVYKSKKDEKHKSMHNLVGVFIKDEPEEQLDATTVLHPFKLIFPGNKAREYYLLTKEEKNKWIEAIKKVIGYSNLFDYYDIGGTLGKGKFGLVKSAIHKKTSKKVAVKIMSKKEMSPSDVELQRREIEVLKMCQHPNIIRLLDIFESQDYIYIVMENLSGGDLFSYLEKRSFSCSEERARDLSHQLSTALYYLHSFGVAHRDLKPVSARSSTSASARSSGPLRLVWTPSARFLTLLLKCCSSVPTAKRWMCGLLASSPICCSQPCSPSTTRTRRRLRARRFRTRWTSRSRRGTSARRPRVKPARRCSKRTGKSALTSRK
jgi:hypothetical protein